MRIECQRVIEALYEVDLSQFGVSPVTYDGDNKMVIIRLKRVDES